MAAASGFTGNKGDIKLATFYFYIHVLQVQIAMFCKSKEKVPVNFRKDISNSIVPSLLSQLKPYCATFCQFQEQNVSAGDKKTSKNTHDVFYISNQRLNFHLFDISNELYVQVLHA